MDPAARIELEAMRLVKPIDEATERGDTDVQRFYRDAVLFITGGTGFIGKQLLEKLFRSCDIRRAYVLIRPKQGKSTKERLQDMLSDAVFEPVRRKKPDLASRIVCVEGDAASIQLGISNDDWNTMLEEVDIIFHVAATVRFDENLRTATMTNVRGTREALALGRACKKLRSFVHVSTAYSHATKHRYGAEVREQFYSSPVPADTLLTLVETVHEEKLDAITSSLISGWPNTYTFTKAVAEELVQAESGYLPVCIVRPSIVLNSYREPLPGWLDMSCVYGPSGIVFGAAMGILRVLRVNNTLKISFVPVDFVNNATIAAGWHTGVRGVQEPLIYNVTSTGSGVTFRHVYNPINTKCRAIVSPLSLWYYYMFETNNRLACWILSWLLHYIPAYIVDAVMHVFKIKKPRGLKSFVHIYTKHDKLCGFFSYFLTHEWHFVDSNLQDLWQKMSSTDKTIYNFDMSSIDWDHNSIMWTIGVRKYLMKDGLKGTEAAVAKQKWLKLANHSVAIVYLAAGWVVLSRLRWLVRLIIKAGSYHRFVNNSIVKRHPAPWMT